MKPKLLNLFLLTIFLFMYPATVSGQVTAEYETDVDIGFFGKYQAPSKPGENVPDNPGKQDTKDNQSKIPTKELSNVQRLPQTNETVENVLTITGISVLVMLLVSLYYKKSEEMKK